MLTILGSLLGFVSSVFPELLGLLKAKQDNAHEIAMFQLQMQMVQAQGNQKLDEMGVEADIAASAAAHAPQQIIGIKWIDALNGTVRPILAYFFFLLYAGMKISAILYSNLDLYDIIKSTPWIWWGEDDMAIFAGIISFYFGNRMMEKVRNG